MFYATNFCKKQINGSQVTFSGPCHLKCGVQVSVAVGSSDLARCHNEGLPIQNAFPYLTVGDREFLLSGICRNCFSKTFRESEEKKRKSNKMTERQEILSKVNPNICMLCLEQGYDRRDLVIDCSYDLHEVLPESLKMDVEGVFYLRLCKSCRAELLDCFSQWREKCRTSGRNSSFSEQETPETTYQVIGRTFLLLLGFGLIFVFWCIL